MHNLEWFATITVFVECLHVCRLIMLCQTKNKLMTVELILHLANDQWVVL